MTTHHTAHLLAMRFRARLWALFVGTVALALLLFWLGIWADKQGGWEGWLLSLIFGGAGAMSLLMSLFTAAMLWGAHKMYRGAMGSLEWYERDPDTYLRAYREVFGPIPWK
jgi:hypothetical protein